MKIPHFRVHGVSFAFYSRPRTVVVVKELGLLAVVDRKWETW